MIDDKGNNTVAYLAYLGLRYFSMFQTDERARERLEKACPLPIPDV
jgi:hypothetical protein